MKKVIIMVVLIILTVSGFCGKYTDSIKNYWKEKNISVYPYNYFKETAVGALFTIKYKNELFDVFFYLLEESDQFMLHITTEDININDAFYIWKEVLSMNCFDKSFIETVAGSFKIISKNPLNVPVRIKTDNEAIYFQIKKTVDSKDFRIQNQLVLVFYNTSMII